MYSVPSPEISILKRPEEPKSIGGQLIISLVGLILPHSIVSPSNIPDKLRVSKGVYHDRMSASVTAFPESIHKSFPAPVEPTHSPIATTVEWLECFSCSFVCSLHQVRRFKKIIL